VIVSTSEMLEVVGGVHDDRERLGRKLRREALDEPRAADATGESDDPTKRHT